MNSTVCTVINFTLFKINYIKFSFRNYKNLCANTLTKTKQNFALKDNFSEVLFANLFLINFLLISNYLINERLEWIMYF